MFYRFSRPLDQITLIGDSILRDIDAHFSTDVFVDLHCLPGAKFCDVNSYIHHTDSLCTDTETVVIHVGTNNLGRGVWEKDQSDFLNLIFTVKETFRSAYIFVCLILPRWDCDLLNEQCKYYNRQIIRLSKQNNYKVIYPSDDFNVSDEYYWRDGLHLNSIGKSFLCNDIVISLETFFSPTSTCTQSTWIPSELKKLHTPKKNKKKLLPWSETDLDLVAYKKREKYGKKSETSRRRRRRKKEPKKKVNRTNDGFIYPTHSYQPPPPPQLPAYRHIPEPLPATIPYVKINYAYNHNVSTTVPIPAQVRPYLLRKKRGQQKRRRQRRERAKRKRKRKKVSTVP